MENIIKELKENLIDDFEEYLEENSYEISKNEILNEMYINNYLMTLSYDINEYTETIKEAEELQDEFYNILDDYICRKLS